MGNTDNTTYNKELEAASLHHESPRKDTNRYELLCKRQTYLGIRECSTHTRRIELKNHQECFEPFETSLVVPGETRISKNHAKSSQEFVTAFQVTPRINNW